MSWLRIDDGFADHPKIGLLSNIEFRVWMKTLCFCARYRDPTVDEATIGGVSGLTAKMVVRFAEVGLLDKAQKSHLIHDWATYAPKDTTGAERQARWRANRNGDVTLLVTKSLAS